MSLTDNDIEDYITIIMKASNKELFYLRDVLDNEIRLSGISVEEGGEVEDE